MRRMLPWWMLALLFVALPILEIYLLIQVGRVVGAFWTVLAVIAVAVAGSYLIKHEGARAWRAFTQALASGRMPAAELADGALILIGGTLLISPGFVSDVFGIVCILPLTRPLARRVLTRLIARRLSAGDAMGAGPAAWTRTYPGERRGSGPDVVRGEVVEDD